MKLRKFYKIAVVNITLLLAFSQLLPETILLKNGGNLKGSVIKNNVKQITVKKESGEETIILKKNITKVVYRDLDAEELEKHRREIEEKEKLKEKQSKKTKKERSGEIPTEGKEPTEKNPQNTESNEKAKTPTNQDESNVTYKKPPQFAILLSMLAPGAGQVYSNRPVIGGGFFVLFGASMVAVSQKKKQYEEAEDIYKGWKNPISNTWILNGIIFNNGTIDAAYRTNVYRQMLTMDFTNPATVNAFLLYNQETKAKENAASRKREYNMVGVVALTIYILNLFDAGLNANAKSVSIKSGPFLNQEIIAYTPVQNTFQQDRSSENFYSLGYRFVFE